MVDVKKELDVKADTVVQDNTIVKMVVDAQSGDVVVPDNTSEADVKALGEGVKKKSSFLEKMKAEREGEKEVGEEQRSRFPKPPRLAEAGEKNKGNSVYSITLHFHTTKAYDVLDGRKAEGGKRAIPNIFVYAARSGVVIDAAMKGDKHVMAYQFLLKTEELIDELEKQLQDAESAIEALVESYTSAGIGFNKIEVKRPSRFNIMFRNPYAFKLSLLALKYDHIERILLPIRYNDLISAQDYRAYHKPIQSLFNRIKTLPDVFSMKRSYGGELPKGSQEKLAEKLDLANYIVEMMEAKKDPDKAKALGDLFAIVGTPTIELIEGKVLPARIVGLKPIKYTGA